MLKSNYILDFSLPGCLILEIAIKKITIWMREIAIKKITIWMREIAMKKTLKVGL